MAVLASVFAVSCYPEEKIDIGYDIDPEEHFEGRDSVIFAENLIKNPEMEDDVDLDLHTDVPGQYGWNWMGGWHSEKVQVMQSDDRGCNGSRCLVILSPNENTDCGFGQVVHGLVPGKPYKATARVKTESVTGGAGAHIALDYLWAPRSNGVTGTSDWTTCTLEFEPDADSVVLCLKLGNTAADSRGVAYFDNVRLTYNTDLYIRTSAAEHFCLMADRKYISVSDGVIDDWLAKLDKVYESYVDLMGGMKPYGGNTIRIRAKVIDAWAYAGNPIEWNENYVAAALSKVSKGDWCFGLMHEMGHDFAPGHIYMEGSQKTGERFSSWIWNEEIFANFRMYYPLTHVDGIEIFQDGCLKSDENGNLIQDSKGNYVSYQANYKGGEIVKMYKTESSNSYDLTIAKGRAVEMGNGMCYVLARMVEECGWKVWQDAFKYLYQFNSTYKTFNNDWERIEYLLGVLDKYSPNGKKASQTISAQELSVIKAYYETVNYGNPIK